MSLDPSYWLWVEAGAVAVLLLGLWSLVRYARTRRVLFLIAGVVLSAGLGVAFVIYLGSALQDVSDLTIIDGPLF